MSAVCPLKTHTMRPRCSETHTHTQTHTHKTDQKTRSTTNHTHTHIPRYKNRQTNASHHGNQSGSSGPEVPFARSPERRCPTSSRPTSVHATNTSIRNGNFKSSPLGFIQPTRTTNHTTPSLGVHLLDHAHWLLSPFGSETLDAPID